MNKKMILPIISLALLIGAMLLTAYFKNIEKGIERQRSEMQNKALDQQEDNLKNENNQAAEESENNAISAEEEVDVEEIGAIEKDFDELEGLVNDPVMENLDLDLESF